MTEILQQVVYKGFLLTRQSKDTNNGIEVSYWVVNSDGPMLLTLPQQRSLFFIQTEDQAQAITTLTEHRIKVSAKALKLTTFVHQEVTALYFDRIKDHRAANRVLNQNGIETYEADIQVHDRLLIERNITSGIAGLSTETANANHTFKALACTKITAAPTEVCLSYLSLDIECSMQGELYSIALQNDTTELVLMIGKPEPSTLNIIWLENESALIQALISSIQELDPDLIIGWSVVNFDFRLLFKRAEKHKIALNFGRNNTRAYWRDNRNDTNQGFVTIPGRVVIDGIDALKTATYHFESFSLENVSRELLNKGKLIEDVKNRAEHITHDFRHNKIKLAQYNLEDCKLVSEIFKKTQLFDFLKLRSQLTGLELDRIGGSVAAFTNLYLPKLHRAGYVAPNLPESGGLASPGGYVMTSIPGLFNNVLVLDFKSLYPSIIRTFKIDPMGLVEGLKSPDNAIEGFIGGLFSREKHFLPEIISDLWLQRDQAKRDKDSARSQALKIIMNSFYGVLGSGGCRFYDKRLASSITLRGQQIMQQTALWIESQGYKVIYGDTDSTFVWLENVECTDEANQIGTDLAKLINQKWQQKLAEEYQLDCFLELEFETLYHKFFMPTIRGSELGSKKRYAGQIVSQGETQLVFKGLETVRSDWTELAREFQTELYKMIFSDQDPSEYIKRVIQETLDGKRDKQLSYRKRLRQKLSAYVKNIPPQVKAARLADQQNQQLGLPMQYQNKGWIKYFITLQGPQPSEYLTAKIDYQHYIDKQIKPVAESILPFIGLNFSQIESRQLRLF
ncbi:DNA polymerase II [Catenovulum maritimum]|uniref:DNA polymerase n=1 Tax=Catenovulum maritimum TaxID=1513271 RepID=A0A0J8GTH7_9ALTE|nr:DNA polymerase II [Catenovulum maritimum]KMT66060.1 DNA polymerase II [Catenovulum maritimum]